MRSTKSDCETGFDGPWDDGIRRDFAIDSMDNDVVILYVYTETKREKKPDIKFDKNTKKMHHYDEYKRSKRINGT